MRHNKRRAKLGRTTAHRRAMLRNMVTSLLRHERIMTTLPKAKEARRWAEKMITLGKRENLHARRQAYRFVSELEVIKKIFNVLAFRYAERKGGYTRIIHLDPRHSDGADMCYLELVDRVEPEVEKPGDKKAKKEEKPVDAKVASPKAPKAEKPKKEKKPKAEKEAAPA